VRAFGSPARKPFTGNRAKKFLSLEELQEREAMAKPAEGEPVRVRAKVKNVRTSGKKMIHMARLITGMKVDDAMAQLYFIKKRRSHVFQRAINFAITVADNEHDVAPENLRVEAAVVNKGQTMKRPRFHGRGKTGRRDHHHCHISVTLVEDTPETAAAAAADAVGQSSNSDGGKARLIADIEEEGEDDFEGVEEDEDVENDMEAFEVDAGFGAIAPRVPQSSYGLRGLKSERDSDLFENADCAEEPKIRMSRRTALAPQRNGTKERKWSLLDEKDVGYTWRSRFLRGNRGGRHDKELEVELVTEMDRKQLERALKYSSWGAKSL
jgi:ribosomal protein L22